MRTLMALAFAAVLAAGCAENSSDPNTPTPTPAPSGTIGPEDTLPVLGAWFSAPMPATKEPLTLTLSDDNTYSVTDSCIELPGRWQLTQGRVVLTPNEDEIVQCEDMSGDLPELSDEFVVEDDRLSPVGDGPGFSRD